MSEELKPCPMCGGDAEVAWHDGFPSVACDDCGCNSGMMISGREEGAIAAWNTRAPDAEIARLREIIASEREDILWNAYNSGNVKDGEWTHMFMLEGEWLAQQCGLDPCAVYYDAATVSALIPAVAQSFAASA